MCIFQEISILKPRHEGFISKLLDRRWMLFSPETKIHQIMLSEKTVQNKGAPLGNTKFLNNAHPSLGDSMERNNDDTSFYILRDDLLHPLVNGNKARKLDGLIPLAEDYSVTDMVTCGGCQSAHAAAVAVSCAERGLNSHLLLRGERPEILTGYNLISTMYGNVTYVPRSLYAKRDEMLQRHAELVKGTNGSVVWFSDIFEASFTTIPTKLNWESSDDRPRKIAIVKEGAGDSLGLLGVIRLVRYLSQNHLFGKERSTKIVVDAGTGTTAVGLALGILLFGLPWEVNAVMLADTVDGYRNQEKQLISDFKRCFNFDIIDELLNGVDHALVHWVERSKRRKFGNVLKGEVEACKRIAHQTGILVDPVYTLAAWEEASLLSQSEVKGGAKVVIAI